MVDGGCGGGRALRRVDSSPRPSLCRSDTIKKKRSKRSRLSAALRELKVAAKERDKDGLLQILVTGHRASSRGSDDGAAGGSGTSTERSVAGTGAEQRARMRRQGGGANAAPNAPGPLLELGGPVGTGGACGRGRRCASWVLAGTLVLALACVVALGTAPAICCCTCAAWLCSERGAQEHASGSDSACARRRGSCRGRVTRATIQPQAGSTLYKAEIAGARAV
ncbi:unnamed protein product [Alopecurus aequalis]